MVIIVKYTVMTSVILLMLAVGLRTPFTQVLQVAKSPSLLMRGLLVNFVVIPVLFYLSLCRAELLRVRTQTEVHVWR